MTPAVLHSEKLAPAAVELVIARARDIDPHGAEGLYRRLIVEHAREERRRTDQIPGGNNQRVRIARGERGQVGGEVLGASCVQIPDPTI